MSNEPAITAKRLTLALCAAGVIGGAVGAIAVNHNNVAAETAPAAAAPAPAAAPAAAVAAPAATVTLPDFTRIAAQNGKAVVNIRVSGTSRAANRGGMPRLDPSHPFYEFFRQFQDPRYGGGGGREAPVVFGAGSGFIVSPDGVILTNAHVVQGADEVTVKLQDRREFRAKVLGSDPKTDVAVLKIDAKNLPVVPVGKSRSLLVGEWVLAIGSPYGLESTVTAGVVSATGRSLPDGAVPFIQTDVAVNPGNSGGPLFNTRGEVVGINSQIYSQTGGYQGLSFSIPIDVAVRIKDQIVATGKVQHAKLGLALRPLEAIERRQSGIASGLVIEDASGAAAVAGIEPGDVLISVNGRAVNSVDQVRDVVAKASKSVALLIQRGSDRIFIPVRIG